MKRMGGALVLLVGLGLSVPTVALGDTSHPHSTQGDSTKSMKAFTKQQKKNQKQTRKAEKKGQKKAKAQAASRGQGLGQAGH